MLSLIKGIRFLIYIQIQQYFFQASYLITPLRRKDGRISSFYWEDFVPDASSECRHLFSLYSHMDECIASSSRCYRYDPAWDWRGYFEKLMKGKVEDEFWEDIQENEE